MNSNMKDINEEFESDLATIASPTPVSNDELLKALKRAVDALVRGCETDEEYQKLMDYFDTLIAMAEGSVFKSSSRSS